MTQHSQGGFRLVNGAWIHPDARIGENVAIEPGAVLDGDVVIGDDCWIGAHAVIRGPTVIGQRNRIHASAIIGDAPQDISYRGEPTRLEIGDDNTFREAVTLHRGTVKGGGLTRIGSHNYFMVGAHVGHDSVIEDHVVLSNDVLIAGHCHVQSNVNMAGGVAIVQFTTIGRHAFLGGLSGSTMDCEPFILHDGLPARPKGVNLVGLRRCRFSHRSMNCLKEAFRILFTASSLKGGGDLDRAREELERRDALCEEVEELLQFMRRSRAGRHGRMLQLDLSRSLEQEAATTRRSAGDGEEDPVAGRGRRRERSDRPG